MRRIAILLFVGLALIPVAKATCQETSNWVSMGDLWGYSSFVPQYRVKITLNEGGTANRTNEPVDVTLDFDEQPYNNSIRVACYDGSWREVPSLLWDVGWNGSYYDNVTVTFSANVTQGSSAYYYVYYDKNNVTKPVYTWPLSGSGDGFEDGIRDSFSGGSYWLDENGNSLTSGLVGYWKFSEDSGNTTYDSSGYENDGTIYFDSVKVWDTNGDTNYDTTDPESYGWVEVTSTDYNFTGDMVFENSFIRDVVNFTTRTSIPYYVWNGTSWIIYPAHYFRVKIDTIQYDNPGWTPTLYSVSKTKAEAIIQSASNAYFLITLEAHEPYVKNIVKLNGSTVEFFDDYIYLRQRFEITSPDKALNRLLDRWFVGTYSGATDNVGNQFFNGSNIVENFGNFMGQRSEEYPNHVYSTVMRKVGINKINSSSYAGARYWNSVHLDSPSDGDYIFIGGLRHSDPYANGQYFEAETIRVTGNTITSNVTRIGESVGTGDGSTTKFRLDYAHVLSGSEMVYLGGSPTSDYTMNYDIGRIDFNTAPGSGVAITADYQYYDAYPGNGDNAVEYAPTSTETTVLQTDVDLNGLYRVFLKAKANTTNTVEFRAVVDDKYGEWKNASAANTYWQAWDLGIFSLSSDSTLKINVKDDTNTNPLVLDYVLLVKVPSSSEPATVFSWVENEGADITITSDMRTEGRYGKALEFDGVDDYVQASDSDSLDLGTNNFTVSYWIKTTSDVQGATVTKRTGAYNLGGIGWNHFMRSNGKIGGGIGDGDQTDYLPDVTELVNSTINDGSYHQVVTVYDRQNGQILGYVDGNFEKSNDISSINGSVSSSAVLRVGIRSYNLNNPFNGTIDEVKVYNRALSEEEIQKNYEAGRIKLSNDFLTVRSSPYFQLNITNNTDNDLFKILTEEILVDETSISNIYPANPINDSMSVQFFDWGSNEWKIWMKGADNATHGMPDWLDPRFKEAFKWRYEFKRDDYPSINTTFLMTAHDPFVRAFLDTSTIKDQILFEDTGLNLGSGGGIATLQSNDVYSGIYAYNVTPPQRYNGSLWSPGYSLKDYPHLTWAWKKGATGGRNYIQIQLRIENSTGTGHWVRFHDGNSSAAWTPSECLIGCTLSSTPPTSWVLHTENLLQTAKDQYDYGSDETTDNLFLKGIAFSPYDGSWGLFDYVYLHGTHDLTIPITLGQNKNLLDDGLVLYQPFEEATGTNTYDYSNYGNDGDITGATWTAGKYGNALSFDGANDYVDCGSDTSLRGGTALTISAWVVLADQPATNEWPRIVNKDVTGNREYHLRLSGNVGDGRRVTFLVSTDGTFNNQTSSNSELSLNAWTHVVGVWNGTHGEIYINGVIDATSNAFYATSTSIYQGTNNVVIGRDGAANYWNGTIDEVRIYDRALSEEEIWQLYQLGQTRIKAGNYYYRNSTSDNVLFTTQNFRTAHRGSFSDPTGSSFELTEDTTSKELTYSYTFNSTLNNNFMFSLGTSDRQDTSLNTTEFAINRTLGFSNETLESVANSTLTYYDLKSDRAVLYLPFEEGTGNVTRDVSGRGNDGTLKPIGSEPNWISGKFGNGLNFDGSDDYVEIPDSDSLDITDEITIAAWVKWKGISGYNFGHIVDKFGSNSAGSYTVRIYNTNLIQSCFVNISGAQCFSGTEGEVPLNEWVHIVVTYDSNIEKIRHYKNGELIKEISHKGTINPSTYPLRIGNRWNDLEHFNGTIDEVKIYDRALSQGEIVRDMQEGVNWHKSPKGSQISEHQVPFRFNYDGGASGIWHFDEGSGNTATDSSGNGNGGYINGSTWITNSSCRYGSCLSFDGVNDYVNVSDAVSLDLDDEWTIEAWVKPDVVSSERRIVGKALATGNDNYRLSIQDGEVYYGWNNDATGWNRGDTTDTNLVAGEWYHVVWTHSGSSPSDEKIFVNGIEKNLSQGFISGGIPITNNQSLGIGADPRLSSYFNGTIDEVRIYPRALTITEVYEHYTQEVSKYYDDFGVGIKRYAGVEDSSTNLQPITPKDTVLHFRFNDNSTINVTDSSRYENDGRVIDTVNYTWITNSSCRDNFGGCSYFDGVNDYIEVPYDDSLNLTGEYTFAMWIKQREASEINYELIFNMAGLSNIKLDSANRLWFGFPGRNIGGGILNVGEWVHLVGVNHNKTDGKCSVYLNGSKHSVSWSCNLGYLSGIIVISAGSNDFNGIIDEVLVINRSLSADEIHQLYLGGYNRTIDGNVHRVASADDLSNIVFNLTNHYPPISSTPGSQGTNPSEFIHVEGTSLYFTTGLGASGDVEGIAIETSEKRSTIFSGGTWSIDFYADYDATEYLTFITEDNSKTGFANVKINRIEEPTTPSCTLQNVSLSGKVADVETGDPINSGQVMISIPDTVYSNSTSFSGGAWSVDLHPCLIRGKTYQLQIYISDEAGEIGIINRNYAAK